MEERLARLEAKVEELIQQQKELITVVESLAKTTGRMDSHIDFVEDTYEALKHPIDYIQSHFSAPAIEN